MRLKKLSKERMKEISRFLMVGGVCFLLDYGLLYTFTEYGGIDYWYSAALSFVVSVVINYWMCLKLVFRGTKRQNARQATLFIGSSVAGLVINQIVMWILVECFAVYYMVAKIVSAAAVTAWNYVMKRKAVMS